MHVNTGWELETLALIERLIAERERAEAQFQAAAQEVDRLGKAVEGLQVGLEEYGRYARPPVAPPEPEPERTFASVTSSPESPESLHEYQHKTGKEMLHTWAKLHGGKIVMAEITKELAALGLFKDYRQAAGSLYPTVTRYPEFRKVGRGVYAPVSDTPIPLRPALAM